MIYQVEVYVVASKYLVPTLCTQIMDGFESMLNGITITDGYPALIKYVAKRIYLKYSDAAAEMKKPLITLLAKHLVDWAGSEELEQLLLEVPELSVQLIRAVVQNGSEAKGAASLDTSSAKARGPKRKRAI